MSADSPGIVGRDEVSLTVVRVDSGGNTGQGRYFYSFNPNILFSKIATQITYVLSEASSTGVTVKYAVSSAPQDRFEIQPVGKDGRTVVVLNRCNVRELISLAIVIEDLNPQAAIDGAPIICDPQVLNVPD